MFETLTLETLVKLFLRLQYASFCSAALGLTVHEHYHLNLRLLLSLNQTLQPLLAVAELAKLNGISIGNRYKKFLKILKIFTNYDFSFFTKQQTETKRKQNATENTAAPHNTCLLSKFFCQE